MFEWKPDYSVQIPAIDAQHQRLFALASELHVAMERGKGQAVLEQALGRLAEYTKVHFAGEEELMRRYRFPGTEPHKKLHDQLTTQVLEFQKRLRRHDVCLTIDLLLFLKNWLEGHIKGSDQKYAAYIRGQTAA